LLSVVRNFVRHDERIAHAFRHDERTAPSDKPATKKDIGHCFSLLMVTTGG